MRRIALPILFTALVLPGCTAWKRCAYEGAGRDGWQLPDQVIASLGVEPGDRVADLGAGSGYFTVRLARAVGPTGQVLAADVDEDMNAELTERLREEGVENVEVILAGYEDPKLPDGSIDLLFTSNTYHHIEDRSAYFERVRRDLAPGGRVAILDYDGSKGWFVRLVGHYTDPQVMRGEMEAAGYQVVDEPDFLDRQALVIFEPKPDGG